MGFLTWIDGTSLAALVRETYYGYPAFLTIHAIGMALLIGAIGVINMRAMGFKVELPVIAIRQLLPLAWLGFAANALSGAALFTADSFYFVQSTTFWIKMTLIVLAAANAWLLGRLYLRKAPAGHAPVPTGVVKGMAGASMVFWFGALIAGRLIAYAP